MHYEDKLLHMLAIYVKLDYKQINHYLLYIYVLASIYHLLTFHTLCSHWTLHVLENLCGFYCPALKMMKNPCQS